MGISVSEHLKVSVVDKHEAEVWSFLESVEDGWDDGKGKAPSMKGLHWLKNSQLALFLHFSKTEPQPWTFPTESPAVFPLQSGEVEFEWAENALSASLKVDVDTRQGILHLRNSKIRESSQINYDFNKNCIVWEVMSKVGSFFESD